MTNDTDWNWGAAVDGLRGRLAGMFPGVCTDVTVYFQGTGFRSVTMTVHMETDGHKCQQIGLDGHDLKKLLRDAHSRLDEGWDIKGEPSSVGRLAAEEI